MTPLSTLWSEYHTRCCEIGRFDRIRSSSLSLYLRWFVGWLAKSARVERPDQLSADVIGAWYRHVAARPCKRTGMPQQPGSIYTEVKAVFRFCVWLEKRGFVTESVIQGFPSMRPPQFRQQLALRHQEVRRYLESLPMNGPGDFLFRALTEFVYSSGVRAKETLQLNVADVDFVERRARVMGKGEKERMVPIGKTSARLLENYLVGVRPQFLRDPAEPALWLNESGRRLEYTSLRARFKARDNAAEGQHVRPHVLRRSCATELIRSGASLWAVKELLGHEDIETLEHYALLDMKDLREMHVRCHPRDLPPRNDP
jgi:site-specific recombinase XerD